MSKQVSNLAASDKTERPVEPPLLEALVFLTSHYGRTKSARAITAGLAFDGQDMGPDLFC